MVVVVLLLLLLVVLLVVLLLVLLLLFVVLLLSSSSPSPSSLLFFVLVLSLLFAVVCVDGLVVASLGSGSSFGKRHANETHPGWHAFVLAAVEGEVELSVGCVGMRFGSAHWG